MGRPINKRFFGPDAGGDGFQITGLAWFAGAAIGAENCYIVSQKSNHRYEISNGTLTEIRTLTDAALVQDDGLFHILVNGTEHANKLSAHRVHTFEGNSFVWSDITKAAASVTDAVDADLGGDTDINP